MQKIKEYNEQEALRLDECFKETLVRVRPYVFGLTSAESAELCKIWLDKLNTATTQRRLRNEYLLELYRQLKTGHIEGIFGQPPPTGLLLPFPKSYHMVCISSSLSDLSDYAIRPHRSCLKPSAKCIQHQRSKILFKHHMMDTTKLQAQNEHLRNQLLEYPRNRSSNMDNHLSASISQLTSDVTTLKTKLTEMQRIKNSLQDSYKETIQQYHYAIIQEFVALRQDLEVTRLKNETLDNSVAMMSEKLEKIIHGKDEKTKVMEKQWIDKINIMCERFDAFMRKESELKFKQELLEKKDLELSQKDEERQEEIELLTNKIQDLEKKLDAKIKDEDKLQAILVEQYTIMKEEFNKMKNEIDHDTQKQNQNLMTKVSTMKKAVTKLEKSKEKLGHDYEKKMFLMIKNKDLEIKGLQLRLQEQKNELCTSLNIQKQTEIDNIVALLEKQYRTRLAKIEAISETQTQEYLRKIAELEDQVLSMKKF